MKLDLFKKIVDDCDSIGVGAITMASRGEPGMNKNLDKMLDYVGLKKNIFEIKLNTNATLLTENLIHSIFRNKLTNVVISADNDELDDDKKRKEVLRLIGRKIKSQAVSSDMDFSVLNPDKIIDNIKYYPATKKLIGQLPKFLFKVGNIPSMKTAKFAYEVSKIIPSIQIKQKK
jgi:hypothetical protein